MPSNPPPGSNLLLVGWRAPLLAALLPVCVLWQFWQYNNFVPFDWGYDDVETYFLPMQQMLHRMFEQGGLHFWNPHIFGGVSLAGNPQAAMFYPLSLISYLLPPQLAFPLLFLLHVALAGLFSYLLARARQREANPTAALLASLCYSLSGCILLGVGQVNQVAIGAWLPAAVLALEYYASSQRRLYLVVQGIAIALIWTAGFPQIALYSQLCIVLYTLLRRPPKLLLAIVLPIGLGFVLSGIQNLPFLETAARTSRAALDLNDWCFADGLSLTAAAQYWFPWMMDSRQANDHYTYFGTIGLLGAGLSLKSQRKEIWGFFGLAIFFFVLSLGMAGPLDFVLSHLPVFKQFKAPWRLNWITTFFLFLCAGDGFSLALGWRPKWGIGLAVLCLVELAYHQSTHILPRPMHADSLRMPGAVRAVLSPGESNFDARAMSGERFATVDSSHSRYGNQGQVWGWSNVVGVDATPTADWCELLLAASLGRRPQQVEIADLVYRSNSVAIPNFDHPIVKMLNVGYLLQMRNGQLEMMKLPTPLPRAWTPLQARVAPHPSQLDQLIDPKFDPQTTVLLEREIGALTPGNLSITDYQCDQLTIQVQQPSGAGLVVLSDAWFPGWEASLDGLPTSILRANYALRAVQVPQGKHQILLRYRPHSLYWGALLSLCGLAYLALEIALWWRGKGPTTEDSMQT